MTAAPSPTSPAVEPSDAPHTPGYDHTQPGGWLMAGLLPYGLSMFVLAWVARSEPVVAGVLAASGALVVGLSFMFHWLRVYDAGDRLAATFGPWQVFGTKVPYDQILEAHVDRSSWLDGWGVHYRPKLGWIFNIQGFDCVRITTTGRTVRLGTDDGPNLVTFLHGRAPKLRSKAEQESTAPSAAASPSVDAP